MKIEVRGLKEVDAQLAALGKKDGTRIVRRALLLAGESIKQQAKANLNAASHSGALRESIGVQFKIGKLTQTESATAISANLPSLGSRFAAVIAPLRKAKTAMALYNLVHKRKRSGIYHGHFLEWGTKASSKRKGSTRAKPFLRPALQSSAGEATRIFAREVDAGITQQLKRNAKKAR